MTNLLISRGRSYRIFKLLSLSLLLTSTNLYSQVGINTTTPEATLDVNGDLIIRQLEEGSGTHVMSIDAEGKVSKFRTFLLYDGDETVAIEPVEEFLSGSETINDLDLGLLAKVTIPPNTRAKVIINYSVPMGTNLGYNPEKTYIGIRFLKDGIEMAEGSRKFTLPPIELSSSNNISSMGTITNTYIENFEESGIERVIVYELRGYIEQHSESGVGNLYKFNMWNAGNNNYNWGKGAISYQTYVR